VLVLEVMHQGQAAGPNGRVCVATTHIYQNQGFPNVKIWQVMTLVRELEKFTVPRQLPLVLTGDLNSMLDSAVYDFLHNNQVSPSHPEVAQDDQGILETAELRHGLQLRDSHEFMGKDIISNYTAGFVGVLDYIWYTAERLRATKVLEQVESDTLSACTALPSPQYSSDHIALLTEFELYPPR
jgi:CCR4-NOT transcription complex subunit 6